MSEVLIVEGLGKRFRRYHTYRPRTFMQVALSGLKKMQPLDSFWALREVSFAVLPGEVLGVLGRNGSGKSTLLRLIGGVGRAEEGKIWVNGRIGALLDMGAGFHNDLTGRENLNVSGLIAGLSKQQVREKFDTIVEFAEIEDFIDSPMRTYSSGMRMRLAFSIAIHNDPDLLLVDEHLSVGDIGFQTKCMNRIEAMRAGGCAIVLISQSPDQIETVCDRAILLNQGKIVAHDLPAKVAARYRDSQN
ncbi:ABC transporter ATP-binding protein [cf. Phormidesmis sp. LEGE 11477]|uniref:ABC transporter ATP-binding protein n=1 Tax=cf. Phormidesmis sp. LEGE 11477 TaxID=1828680 RepID=UPI00187FDE7E|nr:ABC transporter ATP-binding protein [cf. Phormidesmis sp. LEGE 11477]MBE9060369.1 ABC transporter ATP-binding protein [cf. Phormidesmis sp. LEGE 11477]